MQSASRIRLQLIQCRCLNASGGKIIATYCASLDTHCFVWFDVIVGSLCSIPGLAFVALVHAFNPGAFQNETQFSVKRVPPRLSNYRRFAIQRLRRTQFSRVVFSLFHPLGRSLYRLPNLYANVSLFSLRSILK